jgi:fucose 4-O-acetylase-like acetyltransferase
MNAVSRTRLEFIDNLRWVMIVLVISMHAAVTYSHLGSWYFMEGDRAELGTLFFFGYYQMSLQAFFMGLLFLIAGYFVPSAYERKGWKRFLSDRFVRLVIPALFYMLVLHPLTVDGLLRDYHKTTTPFVVAYWNYLRSFRFIGSSGPMWFTVALFLFCVGYVVLRAGTKPKASDPSAPLPTHWQIVGLSLAMGLCTFLVRIVQPMGASILNMQLCFFSQYVLLFCVGVLARQRNWLLRIPYELGMRWLRMTLTIGSLVWFIALGCIVGMHTEQSLSGGFTWQSAVICFWESFFCVGICLGLLVWFRDRFNYQGAFAKWMTDNCFAVYLFHAPVLVALTLLMQGVVAPKPLKFVVATLLGTALTYTASHLVFRRIPVLQRVL